MSTHISINTRRHLITACIFLFLASFHLQNANAGPLSLTILHTNDIRSHFQEFNSEWEDCSVEDSNEGRCFGGWARLDTKISEIRAEIQQQGGHLLLLDAGNQFGGTLWFTVYKDEAASYFMNRTQYDAMVSTSDTTHVLSYNPHTYGIIKFSNNNRHHRLHLPPPLSPPFNVGSIRLAAEDIKPTYLDLGGTGEHWTNCSQKGANIFFRGL